MNELIPKAMVLNLLNHYNTLAAFTDYEFYSNLFDEVGKIKDARRRGKWVDCENLGFFTCTACNTRYSIAINNKTPYCSYCGAKMEE